MAEFIYDSGGQLWRIDISTDGLLYSTSVATPTGGSPGPAPTYTATQIIARALRKIGAVASGEDPTDDELDDGLVELNAMIGQWNAQKHMVNAVTILDFDLDGSSSYTLGPAGDFNTTRPAKIEGIGILTDTTPEWELPAHPMSLSEWQNAVDKTSTSGLRIEYFDDGGNPQRTIYFRGIPSEAASARIYASGLLSRFADLDQSYSFPPEYEEAFVYNLAVRMHPEYPSFPLSPVVASMAQSSLATIKLNNSRPIYIKPDLFFAPGSFCPDINTDNIDA